MNANHPASHVGFGPRIEGSVWDPDQLLGVPCGTASRSRCRFAEACFLAGQKVVFPRELAFAPTARCNSAAAPTDNRFRKSRKSTR